MATKPGAQGTTVAKAGKNGANPLDKAALELQHGKGKVTQGGRTLKAEALLDAPKDIWGATAREIKGSLEILGAKTEILQSPRGSKRAEIIKVTGHPEISQIQVHPGGGRHGGAYYKISTYTRGIIKVVDKNTYKPSIGEKALIIYK